MQISRPQLETFLLICLQFLTGEPEGMTKYTHIILDEVHERSAEADFLCLVVRNLLVKLDCFTKVILMSATLEGSLYSRYFQKKGLEVSAPLVVGGRQFPVKEYFLDDVADRKMQLVLENEERAPTADLVQLRQQARKRAASTSKALLPVPNSEQKKKLRSDDPRIAICCDLVFSQAKLGEGTLVFVPGFDELITVYEAVSVKIAEYGVTRYFKVFLLHSQIPMSEQREAFEEPAMDVAHILLATNVAESSLTIPKLRLVINFCLRRGLRYDTRRQMSMLDLDWCSHASCKQRAGRAGRVFPGVAIHLVPKKFHDKEFPPYDEPEMRTASMPRIYLEAKVLSGYLKFGGASELLMDTLTPPSDMNVKDALSELHRIGAISANSEEGHIKVLGYFCLSLPVDLSLCRLILFGICFECPEAAIIMAAGLTMRQDVFSVPLTFMKEGAYKRSLWLSAKTRWKYDHGQYSEPHMYVKLFQDWMDFKASGRKYQNLCSREELARSFTKGKGLSWERLLQLENTVCDIAQRTKKFVPQECTLYAQLDILSQLGRTSAASRFGAIGSLAMNTDVAEAVKIHGDPGTYKMLLVAAFSHNLLIGQAEFLEDTRYGEDASLVEREAYAEGITLKDQSTLYMRPFHQAEKHVQGEAIEPVTETDLRQVAQHIVWERKHIQTWCFGKGEEMTAVVKFHASFEGNPKTEQMRKHEGESHKESLNFVNFPSQVIAPDAMLQCDAVITWQFGLRRRAWAVGNIRNMPRVLHPCSVAFNLISKTTAFQFVLADRWRNPVGVACDVKNTAPFYAVAANLIGMGAITKATGMCILPRLGRGDNAVRPILMALAFLDFHRDVQFQRVEGDATKFSAILVDGYEMRCPSGQCISLARIMMINRLRKALSEVMSQTNHSILPINQMAHIRPLIRSLLREELVVDIVSDTAENVTVDDQDQQDISESSGTSTDTDTDDDLEECDDEFESHLWQPECWKKACSSQFPLFASVVPPGAILVKKEEQNEEPKMTTRRLAPSVPWKHKESGGQYTPDHQERKEPIATNSSNSSDSEEETMLLRKIDEDVQRLRRITSALPSGVPRNNLLSTVSGAAPHTEERTEVPVFSVGCTDAPEASSDEDSDAELPSARKKDRLIPGQIAKDKSRWPQRIVSAVICIVVKWNKKDYTVPLNKLKSGKNSPFTPQAKTKVLVEFFRQIPRIFQLQPEAKPYKVYFKQADPTLKEMGERERLVEWLDNHYWCVNAEATKKLFEEFQQIRVAKPKVATVVRQMQAAQAAGDISFAPNPYELPGGFDAEGTPHQSSKPAVKKKRSAEGSTKVSSAKPMTAEEQTLVRVLKSLVDSLQQMHLGEVPWDKMVQCVHSPFAETASREAVEGLCLCFREFFDVNEGRIKFKQPQLPEQPTMTNTILGKYRKWKKGHRAALKSSWLEAEKL